MRIYSSFVVECSIGQIRHIWVLLTSFFEGFRGFSIVFEYIRESRKRKTKFEYIRGFSRVSGDPDIYIYIQGLPWDL